MTWHVQYRQAATDQLMRRPSPEAAIEAACRLIDQGCDVYGIGTGPLTDSISRDQIARIYGIWVRAKGPFGKVPGQDTARLGSNPAQSLSRL
jgi:hypothetical protein